MKPSGREQILAALRNAEIDYAHPVSTPGVKPVPIEQQDVRYIEVSVGRGPRVDEVLNALDAAGLMSGTQNTDSAPLTPSLLLVDVDRVEGTFYFEDAKSASQYWKACFGIEPISLLLALRNLCQGQQL